MAARGRKLLQQQPLSGPLISYSLDKLEKLYEGDARCALNWSTCKRLAHSAVLGITTFTAYYNAQVLVARNLPEPELGPKPELNELKNKIRAFVKEMWPLLIALLLAAGLSCVVFLHLGETFGRMAALLVMLFMLSIVNTVYASNPKAFSLKPSCLAAACLAPPLALTCSSAMSDIWPRQSANHVRAYLFVCNVCGLMLPPWFLPNSAKFVEWRRQYVLGAASCFVLAAACLVLLSETYWPVLAQHQHEPAHV